MEREHSLKLSLGCLRPSGRSLPNRMDPQMRMNRRRKALCGSILSFVFRVGLFFFGWLRFCHGAVAPSGSPRAAGLWGRVAPIPKASASFVKSLPKLDGKLVGRHPPGQRWICPRFGDVSQGQIDELGGRFVARKVPPILQHLAQLHMANFQSH
jgi:hypothetical protein